MLVRHGDDADRFVGRGKDEPVGKDAHLRPPRGRVMRDRPEDERRLPHALDSAVGRIDEGGPEAGALPFVPGPPRRAPHARPERSRRASRDLAGRLQSGKRFRAHVLPPARLVLAGLETVEPPL